MTVTALVMAGGKGARLALAEEKPLLKVCGKPVIDLVLAALRNSKMVDDVVVAVSPNTPKTAKYLEKSGVHVEVTPGEEFVFDMVYAVKSLGLDTILVVAADLPLLTGEVVDDIVGRFFQCGKSALAVAVPQETRERLGLNAGYIFDLRGKQVVYAGINVLDGKRIDDAELEQFVYVVDKVEVAVNINTTNELSVAEDSYLKKINKIGL